MVNDFDELFEEKIREEADEFEMERKEQEREAQEYWDEHYSGRAFGVSDKDFI